MAGKQNRAGLLITLGILGVFGVGALGDIHSNAVSTDAAGSVPTPMAAASAPYTPTPVRSTPSPSSVRVTPTPVHTVVIMPKPKPKVTHRPVSHPRPVITHKPPAKQHVSKPKPVIPAGATAQCNDGTYSYSQHRRGTCSHHGGVATWYPPLSNE